MGWPPTKRGWSTAATMGAFTLPTSVTIPPPARAARATSATAETGVATKMISASGSWPSASRAPSSTARRARARSASTPVTCQPRARRARPMDAPISPVPRMAARPGLSPLSPRSALSPTGSGASFREVIAQPPGALQVDVVQLGPAALGVQVHEHADAALGGARHAQLLGAEEGDVAQPDRPGRGGGEGGDHVGRGREDHADEVVLVDAVALEHGRDQAGNARVHLLPGVFVDGRGASERPHGGGHRRRMLSGRQIAPASPAGP